MKSKLEVTLTPEEKVLRDHALGLPEATEDFPWGSRAFKVAGKAFVFMSNTDDVLSVGTKLPQSKTSALKAAFASPTHYGLGRHGWVTCEFQPGTKVPVDLLLGYVDESYRAVAPKRLIGSSAGSGKVADESKSRGRKATKKAAKTTKRRKKTKTRHR